MSLADVPPRVGKVVIIGINPSPVSVAAGHYYQGTLGKRLWSRLVAIGLLDRTGSRWEDERWQAAGHGLTDIVKRPTASAREVARSEMVTGADLLRAKLVAWKPSLILFPFLAAAEAVLGSKPPPGPGPLVEGIPTFRLAGPYAPAAEVDNNGQHLAKILGLRGEAGEPNMWSSDGSPMAATSAIAGSSDIVSQPITSADRDAGRIRFPRAAKPYFPATRSMVTVVLRGIRLEARYDPRTGPDRERSGVLGLGTRALAGITESERLQVSVRPTDGLVSLD